MAGSVGFPLWLRGLLLRSPPGHSQPAGLALEMQGSLNPIRNPHWDRKQQPTPVFLPGKFCGQRSLAGYNPWGHRGSDTTEHTHPCSLTHTQRDSQPKAERTRWASGPARGQVNLPCLRQKIWGHSVCSLDILGSPATAVTSFTYSEMSLPVSTPFSLLPPSCILVSLSPRQAQTHPGLRLCMQGAPPRQMPSL